MNRVNVHGLCIYSLIYYFLPPYILIICRCSCIYKVNIFGLYIHLLFSNHIVTDFTTYFIWLDNV